MNKLTTGILIASGLLVVGGELADQFSKQLSSKPPDFRQSRSHEEVEATNHGITELGIERTICFGTCPDYTFIVKSDGTFEFWNGSDVNQRLWTYHLRS